MGALQPLIIFLRQEIDRMQRVITIVRNTLTDLQLAIEGTIIMSEVRFFTHFTTTIYSHLKEKKRKQILRRKKLRRYLILLNIHSLEFILFIFNYIYLESS